MAAVDASSDATAALAVNQNLTWMHAPAAAPTLVTVACAVHQTDVSLSVLYGGLIMLPGMTNQASNQFVGLYYRTSPASGNQSVTVTLSAAAGLANVQCSATSWTNVSGVDLSRGNWSQDLSGGAFNLAIGPSSPLPTDEFFLAALHRYMPQGYPTLYVAPANASLVDSNTNVGNGTGHGCQAVTFAYWEDCIATAQLVGNGTSMRFSWVSPGYAIAVGIGLVKGTPPASGGGAEGTILGLPTSFFLVLILLTGIGVIVVVGGVLVVRGRPPKG